MPCQECVIAKGVLSEEPWAQCGARISCQGALPFIPAPDPVPPCMPRTSLEAQHSLAFIELASTCLDVPFKGRWWVRTRACGPPWRYGPCLSEASMPEAGLSRAILGFAGVRSVGLLCSVSRDLGLEATKVKKVVDCLAAGAQVRPTLGWQCGQAGGTGQVFICGGYDGARPFAGRRRRLREALAGRASLRPCHQLLGHGASPAHPPRGS